MRAGKKEIEISGAYARARIDLDGKGSALVDSGSGFMDHMLAALAKVASFDLKAASSGSSISRQAALGMAIGLALDDALLDRTGICRYGWASVPMDEALACVAVDFSGRPYLVMSGSFAGERIADLETYQIRSILESLSIGARLTVHIRFCGENDHHKAESIFKALGLALSAAASRREGGVLSTKGVI